MASDNIVDEIGLKDPPKVFPIPTRVAAQYVEKPAKGRRDKSQPAFVPAWVTAAREWSPVDLDTIVVDVRYAVEGLIPSGKVGALVAAGGTGKTILLLVMFVCIALGRDFMGRKVDMGTCVLLSNDDPGEELEAALSLVCRAMKLSQLDRERVAWKVRLISLQGHVGTKTFTTSVNGTMEATGLDEFILQALDGIDDLVCVALDTLRQFSGGSTNDEQVIKLAIEGATNVALQTGAAVVIPHHTGKANFREGIADMYAGTGSAALADNARFVLVLQETTWPEIEGKVSRTGQEDGDPLVLTPTRGSLLVKKSEPIFMCRRDYLITRVAGKTLTRDQQEDRRDRAILAAVRSGAQTATAIANAVKGRRQAALERVNDLESRGLLQRDEATSSRGGSQKLMLSARGGRVLDANE